MLIHFPLTARTLGGTEKPATRHLSVCVSRGRGATGPGPFFETPNLGETHVGREVRTDQKFG